MLLSPEAGYGLYKSHIQSSRCTSCKWITGGQQLLCRNEAKDITSTKEIPFEIVIFLMNKHLNGLQTPCHNPLQRTGVALLSSLLYSSLHVSLRSHLISVSLCFCHSLLFPFFFYQFKWYFPMNKCPNLSVSFIQKAFKYFGAGPSRLTGYV